MLTSSRYTYCNWRSRYYHQGHELSEYFKSVFELEMVVIDRPYTYAQISLANLAEPGLLSARDDKK